MTDPSRNALRQQTLRNLALTALRDRRPVVDLDDDTLAHLETCSLAATTAPPSLDMNVFVAAPSAAALDAGQFQIIVGPNLGAQAAGRNLGRFADLLVPESHSALTSAARAEEAHAPHHLWAELVYLPPRFRSANVVVRPAVRGYEIALGAGAGTDTSRQIPLDELLVGVRNRRFYIRWPAGNADVVVCAGHMLNNLQAPPMCQFLTDVSRDGQAQLSAFDWGMVADFPFLPRVQVGRIVLRPAQWRIDRVMVATELPSDPPEAFQQALGCWRDQWLVPRHVYLSAGDNRLMLDLDDAAQAEELRTEIRHLREGGHVVLQEVVPALDHLWLEGPGGHFVAELVVSLVRRYDSRKTLLSAQLADSVRVWDASPAHTSIHPVPVATRLRPPGSEWLFVKLYCGRAREEELIAGPLCRFAEDALARGLAEEWFFVRYSDPDPHVRLRFRGPPERLTGQLFPALCSWGAELIAMGLCLRFSFDTYEREIERYGGAAGMQFAEALFAADSRAVAELLQLFRGNALTLDRTTLGVLSVDSLLAALGLSEAARLEWYRGQGIARHLSGPEYRQRKTALRALLGDPCRLLAEPSGAQLMEVFAARRAALARIAERLAELLEHDELGQAPSVLYRSFVHLHCNRLLGPDGPDEQQVIGLLVRTWQGLEREAAKVGRDVAAYRI
jgi:thiopeptide-type bacteriocin biosynthesis protein